MEKHAPYASNARTRHNSALFGPRSRKQSGTFATYALRFNSLERPQWTSAAFIMSIMAHMDSNGADADMRPLLQDSNLHRLRKLRPSRCCLPVSSRRMCLSASFLVSSSSAGALLLIAQVITKGSTAPASRHFTQGGIRASADAPPSDAALHLAMAQVMLAPNMNPKHWQPSIA